MSTRILAWPAFKPETGNPYSALLSAALERRGAAVAEFSPARVLTGHYDVWHIHWPERIAHRSIALARLALFGLLVVCARLRGTRIVWTAHNLEGHARRHPALERGFMRWLTRHLDGVVYPSETGARMVRERYPALDRTAAAIVPLGHYAGTYPNDICRADARTLLGLDAGHRVLAFVGRIAPYKNVQRLISEFRALGAPDARLVVAGRPASPDLLLELMEAAGGDSRILLRLEEIPDEELQVVLNAADVVVLPYERILNSGSALLALSFGRPVLVPDTGALADLRDRIGADAVRLYDGPLGTEHLRAALVAEKPDRGELIGRVLDAFDWDRIADDTLALYAEAAR